MMNIENKYDKIKEQDPLAKYKDCICLMDRGFSV